MGSMTKDEAIEAAIEQLEEWRKSIKGAYSKRGKWFSFAIIDGIKAKYTFLGEIVEGLKL